MTDSNTEVVAYSGEVILVGWGTNASSGHTIRLALPTSIAEAHPFALFPKGMEHGQRFLMSFTPVLDDQTTVTKEDINRGTT